MHLADIPATLTITNVLNETLVIATSIRLEPLEADAVIRMAGRGRGNKSNIYQALFIAEQMGHIEAGGLSPLTDPVSSGHTLFGGQDPIRDVEPEGRAGVLGIHTGAPTVGRPILRGIADLTPLGVATGAPTVGAPALLGIADLTPLGIATGAPTVGAPALHGVTALTPLGIATGAPTVGAPALEDIPAVAGPPTWIEYDSTYGDYISPDLGTGPYTDLAFSGWLKCADWSKIRHTGAGDLLFTGNGSDIHEIAISLGYLPWGDGGYPGCLVYAELSQDDGKGWKKAWAYTLPTDGLWHSYGIKAGYCCIDGVEQTPVHVVDVVDDGANHPSVLGNGGYFMVNKLSSGGLLACADIRAWMLNVDVQSQAGYLSTLCNNVAGQIYCALYLNEGTGIADDRSVEENDLTLATGMTWKP